MQASDKMTQNEQLIENLIDFPQHYHHLSSELAATKFSSFELTDKIVIIKRKFLIYKK